MKPDKIYGLIGKTLIHSYSKEIHEALGKYNYELFSLSPEEMLRFVKARDFDGLNVTIPYKQDVMPLCDEVSELACEIGAVNTLYWSKEDENRSGYGIDVISPPPKLMGHNTDYEGFIYAARRAKIDFANQIVLILGSGGTSLMVHKAACDMGATRIFTASRSHGTEPGENIRRDVGCIKNNFATGSAASMGGLIAYDRLADIAGIVDIIVNTTPVGTYPGNSDSLITLKDFPRCSGVMDVIYNPFKTALLFEAEKLGISFSNGLPMLVAQATAAAGYFLCTPGAFGCENERIIGELELSMRNIVLIGMPGSGKTTIGKLIAEKTGKAFVDMDEEIAKVAGMAIPRIFAKYGESYFRDLEGEVSASLGKEHGKVIATGGGTILHPENVNSLRQNGLLIHVTRPLENLATSGRPLSVGISSLRVMEKKRLPLYEAAADMTFDNSGNSNTKQLADSVMNLVSLINR